MKRGKGQSFTNIVPSPVFLAKAENGWQLPDVVLAVLFLQEPGLLVYRHEDASIKAMKDSNAP